MSNVQHYVNTAWLLYKNTLLNGVHNFAHLNLSIAIFLALTVFVAGIETATNNEVNCCYNIKGLYTHD